MSYPQMYFATLYRKLHIKPLIIKLLTRYTALEMALIHICIDQKINTYIQYINICISICLLVIYIQYRHTSFFISREMFKPL